VLLTFHKCRSDSASTRQRAAARRTAPESKVIVVSPPKNVCPIVDLLDLPFLDDALTGVPSGGRSRWSILPAAGDIVVNVGEKLEDGCPRFDLLNL
jgi:hypothetical protein